MTDQPRDDEARPSHRQTAEDYFASDPSARARIAARNPAAAIARPRMASYGGASPGDPLTPGTPRTPILSRSLSSNFNSPGGAFRTDDDVFVLEFGARYLRVGLGGENKPRCHISFGPEEQKRVGDYSSWVPSLAKSPRRRERLGSSQAWGQSHELWQMDLRSVDLGLVSDKIERAVRSAISEHVLVLDDMKRRLFVLAVPPVMSGQLLSTLLTTLFNGYPIPPSITVLPSPILCTMAAGLRSALVIDLGWAETVVSAVYEYRQVLHRFSSRGMKRVHWKLASIMNGAIREELKARELGSQEVGSVTFEESEEVLLRMAWIAPDIHATTDYSQNMVDIPVPSHPEVSPLRMPFLRLSEPATEVLFPGPSSEQKNVDENGDLPLCDLIYKSLLSLPIDIRGHLLSRIIITGGGSHITGMKSRIMSELIATLRERGWDPVNSYGSAKPPPSRPNTIRKSRLKQKGPVEVYTSVEVKDFAETDEHHKAEEDKDAQPTNKDVDPESSTPAHLQPPDEEDKDAQPTNKDVDPESSTPAHLQPPLPDPFYKPPVVPSVPGTQPRTGVPYPPPPLRSVNTLGAWAGASLLSGLRVKAAIAEIEREKFLSQGLAGFSLDEDRVGNESISADGPADTAVPTGVGLGIGGKRQSAMFTGGR